MLSFPRCWRVSGDLDRARRLQESSYKMWTTFGIEPETLDYTTMKITSPGYQLRPEIIESAYYLDFYTKDPRYQEMGSTFILSLVRYCKTDAGLCRAQRCGNQVKERQHGKLFIWRKRSSIFICCLRRGKLLI